eukprot:gene9104-10787_t
MYGLSALVFTTSYKVLFHERQVELFLVFAGVVTGGTAVAGTIMLRRDGLHSHGTDIERHQDEETGGSAITASDASVDTGDNMYARSKNDSCQSQGSTTGDGGHAEPVTDAKADDDDGDSDGGQTATPHCAALVPKASADSAATDPVQEPQGVLCWSGVGMACNPVFLQLYFCFFLVSGSGLLFINNTGSIAKANGLGHLKSYLVGSFSLMNCLGRAGAGVWSDMLPRTLRRRALAVPAVVMGAAYAVLAVHTGSSILLMTANITIGLSYGA